MTPSEGDASGARAPLEERVSAALTDARVGSDVLTDGLAQLGGIGDVVAANGEVTVEVSLPIPHGGTRRVVVSEIESALASVDGVQTVTCEWRPSAADPGVRVDLIPEVKHVVAVFSGKGGVGKSTVAVNLAAALADAGASVGLLDADIYGPNAPTMLGLSDATPEATRSDEIVPREAHGVRTMSIDFIAGEDDPIIWRGPMVDGAIKQFFGDVEWGDLDYLVVDLPPGTGDAQVTLTQYVPTSGAVIVTTPQAVAVDDAERGIRMFEEYDVPLLGIAENMAEFQCPDCGSVSEIFGEGGALSLAQRYEIPVLGRLPVDPAVSRQPTGTESSDSAGVSLPLLGRLQLPRTRDERDAVDTAPPAVFREDAVVGDDLRLLATRTAARLNALAVEAASPTE